jgi:hypothetical protein
MLAAPPHLERTGHMFVLLGFWTGVYDHTEFQLRSVFSWVWLQLFSFAFGIATFTSVAKRLKPGHR